MTVLDEIRIGPYCYRVAWQEGLIRDEGEDGERLLNGSAHYEDCLIRISLAAHPAVQRAVVLHEVIHVCFWLAGHNDHQEGHVQALGNLLLGVLRDNPKLVVYLMEEEQDGRETDHRASAGPAAQSEGDGGAGVSGGDADRPGDPVPGTVSY